MSTPRIRYLSTTEIVHAIHEGEKGCRRRKVSDPEGLATKMLADFRALVKLARRWDIPVDRTVVHANQSAISKYTGTVVCLYFEDRRMEVSVDRAVPSEYEPAYLARVALPEGCWARGVGSKARIRERERGTRKASRPRWGSLYMYLP